MPGCWLPDNRAAGTIPLSGAPAENRSMSATATPARGSIPTRVAVVFAILALVLEAASLVFYSAAAGYSTSLSVPPIALLASGPSGVRLIEWGSLVDLFGYLCIAPVVLYLRDRYAGARAVNLYAIAGVGVVVIGPIGDVVMRAAASYLIHQYQAASPSGRHSIEFVFGALYRGVVEGMWQTLVALLAAIWLIGTAIAIRGRASRAVLVIMLLIGLLNAGLAVYRLSGL